MRDFGPWLHDQNNADPAMAKLKTAARQNASDWPYYSNELEDYLGFVDSHVEDADKSECGELVSALHGKWLAETGAGAANPARFQWFFGHLTSIALIGFGVLVAVGIIWALSSSTFLQNISDIEMARGLITFLVAVTTIAVALFTTISVFWVPEKELEARFTKAKDVLAILVGILGTILGFYFGSGEGARPANDGTPPADLQGEAVSGAPAGESSEPPAN